MNHYRWFRAGDINAFFALMFDNVANLVILAGILIGAFHMPKDIVLYRMVPGTAIGVLLGDLIYAWMAIQLARKSNREDVTAMPLGLNAPSVLRHTDCRLFSEARARLTFSRISAALAVQMKGLGFSLCWSM
jgi:hypothetical protein